MIKEHDRVVLTVDRKALRLSAGDVGTVVHIYQDASAYEVEFFTLDGSTFTVATLEAPEIRPVHTREMTHARTLD